MTKIPDGFEKPRRKPINWKWLAFPSLVVAIFAFIMLRVMAAKEDNDRQESAEFLRQLQSRQRAQSYERSLPFTRSEIPGADQDSVADLPDGITERRFAGLVMHHPTGWKQQISDNPLGRSIALGGSASAITVLVSLDMSTADVLAGIGGAMKVEGDATRTIAGEVRFGRKGTVTAMGMTTRIEAFTFSLGPYTIGFLWQFEPSVAKEAEADLNALTRLEVAE